jgi:glycosyltransferase involved in cell wall biosynthesis
MHDMFYFTGGCHYSYTCDRYTSACNANCPQLANAQRPALAQTGFEIKQQAYRQVKQPLHFISPSKWLKAAAQSSTLLQHFPHHHIPYGIDLAQFRPGDQAQARAALGLPQAPFLAFFMAPNLADPRKGGQYIRQLLEQSTLQQNANLEFCVAGPQKGRDAFLDLGVHNLGYLADETAVIQALQAVDVLLFPSIQDNLPNTLIEAQACGTPAIAFDIPGVNEIIQHQHNGFLAPVGDIARIHQSLEDLASQSEKLAAMAAAARKHAEHTYSLGEQAYAYERITTTMKAS